MMQTKVESGNHRVDASGAYAQAQPWWQGYGNTDNNGGLRTREENSNVVTVGSFSNGINVNKDIPSGIALRPDGYNGQGNQTFNATQVTISENPSESSQRELVNHSTVMAAYPYQDLTYGAIVPPFGQPPLVHPHLYGVQQPRMPLRLEMEEEPVYVNAKQYNGIMRRRQIRAKAELEKKIIKNRKPYLHESRHQHAMRRARGCGGRFLNTKKLNNSIASSKNGTQENGITSNSNQSMLPNDDYMYLTTEPQSSSLPRTITRMSHNNDVHMRSSAYHHQSMPGDDQAYLQQRREQGMKMTGHAPRVLPIT